MYLFIFFALKAGGVEKKAAGKKLNIYHATYQKKNNKKNIKKITQTLQICIGPTIRIGRKSWCLPYAGFFIPH